MCGDAAFNTNINKSNNKSNNFKEWICFKYSGKSVILLLFHLIMGSMCWDLQGSKQSQIFLNVV